MLIVKNRITTSLTNFLRKMARSFVALYTMTIERTSGNIQSIEAGVVGMCIGDKKPARIILILFIFFTPDHFASTAVCHIDCA